MPGSQTCSPNSHRKPHRNVLRVFDVCSEKQCDSKSYFAFVVETFSEHVVHTEIPRSRNSCVTTLFVTVSSRQSVQQSKSTPSHEPEFLRIRLLEIQNNFYNRFAFPNKHQVLSFRRDFLWEFGEQFWLPGIYAPINVKPLAGGGGGRPGKGGAFELSWEFPFKCPTPGHCGLSK